MSTTTLPFNKFTNRILEQSGYSDLDVLRKTDTKTISNSIKSAGFDASKSRVCIQEISDYFAKEDKETKEATAQIRSVQYLSPTASEIVAKRKKIIDKLFNNEGYYVTDNDGLAKLLKDLSDTATPISMYTLRDSIKAIGYFFTTATGTRKSDACYISRTKDKHELVLKRVEKVLGRSTNVGYYIKSIDEIKVIRANFIKKLASKPYVIMDKFQFEAIRTKISRSNQPIDFTTYRLLCNENNLYYGTLVPTEYYYASATIPFNNDQSILDEELKKHPRVYKNFEDDIAKLLIDADIVYIEDFISMDDQFIEAMLKDVNYSEDIIQECMDAIHKYKDTHPDTKQTKEEKPMETTKDIITKINNLSNNITKETTPSTTKEDSDSSTRASEILNSKLKSMGFKEFKPMDDQQPKNDISFGEFIANSIKTGMSTEVFRNELRSFITNHPDKLNATEMEAAKAFLNGPNPFSTPFNNLFGNPMPHQMNMMNMQNTMMSVNPSYQNTQPQQPQVVPKMINPTISGTCPCCHAPFSVPATMTHRVYCFSCGTLMEY